MRNSKKRKPMLIGYNYRIHNKQQLIVLFKYINYIGMEGNIEKTNIIKRKTLVSKINLKKVT